MKYYVEDSLSNFQFWSGGRDRANLLSNEQLDTVEQMLEEIAPEEGWSDTAINDFFWFEFDTIAEWLGYKNEEYFDADVSDEDIDNAQGWFYGHIDNDDFDEDRDFYENLTGIKMDEYYTTSGNGNKFLDKHEVYQALEDWWNNLSEMEQGKLFQQYVSNYW